MNNRALLPQRELPQGRRLSRIGAADVRESVRAADDGDSPEFVHAILRGPIMPRATAQLGPANLDSADELSRDARDA